MTLTIPTPRIALRCALAGLIPPVSLVIAFIAAFGIGSAIPDISDEAGQALVIGLALVVLAIGGGLWGGALMRITGAPNSGRLVIAAALSQAVMTVLAVTVLGRLEGEFVERGNTTLPIHVLFTLLFVPATFIVAFVIGFALGLALGDVRLALRMGSLGGFAAALAFLMLNVLQDLLGRRVGGPNAAETATMITVTLVCTIGAAMAFSAVIGRLLAMEARS